MKPAFLEHIRPNALSVMAGLVPAIHAETLLHSVSLSEGDVDARIKCGHDGAFFLFAQTHEALS